MTMIRLLPRGIILPLAAVIFLATAWNVLANVIHVPADHETIQDAINAAEDGDTVLVADGEYTGDGNVNLVINAPIVLASENGPLECIIDGEGNDNTRGITVDQPSIISGFTITGATVAGIIVQAVDGFEIRDCIITDNNQEIDGVQGAGINIINLSTGTIENCLIAENSTVGSGAGLYIRESTVTVRSCFIIDNVTARFGGGAHSVTDPVVEYINCVFAGNQAGIDGGGLGASLRSTITVSNCTFFENEAAGWGGGLYSGSDTEANVIDCIFWGNAAEVGPQLAAQANNNGVINISFCDVEGGPDENGNWDGEDIIDEEPEFTDGRAPMWGPSEFFLDPESPCIDAGSAPAQDVGMEEYSTQADLSPDEDDVDLGFHYHRSMFRIVGALFGRITDAETGDPIDGASVGGALTDENGEYRIEGVLAEIPFDILVSADGYNDSLLVDIMVEEDEELELNAALLHPEFELIADDEISVEINAEDSTAVEFTLLNDGNGTLEWQVETRLPDEFNFDPWTQRDAIEAGAVVDDARLGGVVFIRGQYYVSGAGDDQAMMYILDGDGNEIDRFPQPGEAALGMRDLAWDEELIWGSGERDVFGITTRGDLRASFEGAFNPNQALAWDDDRELLWICGVTTNIVGFTREGEEINRLNNPDLRIYGLAYWADDPDGYPLYILNLAGGEFQAVHKMNPDNGDTLFVSILQPEGGGRPSGAHISEQFDPYSVTLIALTNDAADDRIDVWQVDARTAWMSVAPDGGDLVAGGEEQLILSLMSFGMSDGFYEGVVAFRHNAVGGQATLPIVMRVVEGPVQAVRAIDLRFGWNLVSANLQPEERDVVVLTQDLVDAGLLMMMKDGMGHFYSPERDFNDIDGWDVERAYLAKMNGPGRLTLEGITVRSDEPIALLEGWNYVSYYPRRAQPATQALAGIADRLVIAKDGDGNFYAPEWGWNALNACREGSGYVINVSENVELVWGGGDDREVDFSQTGLPSPRYFESPPASGSDMSLLLIADGFDGGEAAVYANEAMVGSGVFADGRCGIAVRGDDPTTEEIDGATAGNELSIKLKDAKGKRAEFELKMLRGTLVYESNQLVVAQLSANTMPLEFALEAAYPNPFNNVVSFGYSLPLDSELQLAVWDLAGRKVAQLARGRQTAGWHKASWTAESHPSGMYIIRIEAGGATISRKVVLMR